MGNFSCGPQLTEELIEVSKLSHLPLITAVELVAGVWIEICWTPNPESFSLCRHKSVCEDLKCIHAPRKGCLAGHCWDTWKCLLRRFFISGSSLWNTKCLKTEVWYQCEICFNQSTDFNEISSKNTLSETLRIMLGQLSGQATASWNIKVTIMHWRTLPFRK